MSINGNLCKCNQLIEQQHQQPLSTCAPAIYNVCVCVLWEHCSNPLKFIAMSMANHFWPVWRLALYCIPIKRQMLYHFFIFSLSFACIHTHIYLHALLFTLTLVHACTGAQMCGIFFLFCDEKKTFNFFFNAFKIDILQKSTGFFVSKSLWNNFGQVAYLYPERIMSWQLLKRKKELIFESV